LGHAGANVVVNYVTRPDAADEVVQQIRSGGTSAYAQLADVSQEDQVEDMFRQMVEKFSRIDILVNNAGLQRDSPSTR
jgi:glucose 1-dehydrogenase